MHEEIGKQICIKPFQHGVVWSINLSFTAGVNLKIFKTFI